MSRKQHVDNIRTLNDGISGRGSSNYGVNFLFFDNKTASWLAADTILRNRYGSDYRMSFSVYPTLSEQQQEDVVELQDRGNDIQAHEIECTYIALDSVTAQQYYTNVIAPAKATIESWGINSITEFSYPCGEATEELDNIAIQSGFSLMVHKFSSIVDSSNFGITIGQNLKKGAIFCQALLDVERASYDLDYIKSTMDYARANNTYVCLAGHEIDHGASIGNLTIPIADLIELMDYAVSIGLPMVSTNQMSNNLSGGALSADPYVSLIFLETDYISSTPIIYSIQVQEYQNTTEWYQDGPSQGGSILESGSTYQHYSADDIEGLNEAPVPGATSPSWTPGPTYIGKFTRFGVIPRTASGAGVEHFTARHEIV